MIDGQLAAVERARQIHFGAIETARSDGIDLRLNPGQVLAYAHDVLSTVIPGGELEALDLAYTGLLRRMKDPTVVENLDEVLQGDEDLIREISDGLDILQPTQAERLDAWVATERLAGLPIEMKELEEIQIDHADFVNRFMGDVPARP